MDVELSDISTSLSTAACPGLVLGVSKVLMHIITKQGTTDEGTFITLFSFLLLSFEVCLLLDVEVYFIYLYSEYLKKIHAL